MICTWCGDTFEPRNNGGKPQRFCSIPCRRNFNAACRIWGAQEYEGVRVSIFELRTALYQRARCVQRNPAPKGCQSTTETPARPSEAPHVAISCRETPHALESTNHAVSAV